ncbi:hypothetical protein KJ785_00955 [Patescibacteria group bacterium]|nr:hypothetical protein [Patescibacteria group bacterium]
MKFENILQNYGLSRKEAKVYLACLELGSASVQKIARKSGLARSTVYEVLDDLNNQNFVNSFRRKRVKYFSAEDPAQVIKLAQMKVDAMQEVLPQLNAMYGQAKHRPTVRFYQGKDGMKIILEEVLDEADEMLSFGSAEDLFRELGDYFNKFVERRIKKKIPARVILNESKKAQERKRLGPQHLRQVKILPDRHLHQGQIFIWKNKIAMFSFTNDFVAIVIESKELYVVQKAMFEHLWELAE